MTKILINIRNGEVKSKVQGISGAKCMEVDKFLKQLGDVVKQEKTKEYYQSEVEVQKDVGIQG